jgi:aspartyl-tRNA(Asn)/glutamyl-tRNA(Gln) amidotransferase subunit B
MAPQYTTIIGLEVHVQLSTASKLFCGCSTRFGAEPNTQTCPVCIGMPGSLPVMNREAFRLALKTAVALNCQIPPLTKWDRKQYYYPDLPKGYQISQYDLPMSANGYLEISDPKGRFETKRVRIRRAHLEEDAGKSLHDEIAGKADSLIDLNRTGTPLLEIVTEPDLRSSGEAKAFLTELKLLLTYIGASDCNMQEGSLRVDANVNLHIPKFAAGQAGHLGDPSEIATPIVEIKNMNSFRAVERALDYEAQRQFSAWQETRQKLGDVPKQTRGWDDAAGVTRGQRSKEESSDYRYFPDPDLVPVVAEATDIETARESLGELPAALRRRLETDFGLSTYDADVLVNQGRATVDYFLVAFQVAKDAKRVAAWIINDVSRTLNARPELTIETYPIRADVLGQMVARVLDGSLPAPRAAEVFMSLFETGCNDIDRTIEQLDVSQIDETELTSICRQVIATNPKSVADIRGGKVQAIGALIGQAKKINPNIDPNKFKDRCMALIYSEM